MDKYFTVTVEENGDYTMALNMAEDDLLKFAEEMMGEAIPAEYIQQVKDMLDFSVKADAALKNGKSTSSMDYVIGMNYAEDGESVKFTLKLTATSTGDMNATPETPKVPSSALDVMDVINLLGE